MTTKVYSQEERLMAALSHGSIIVSGMGIVVAAIVWLTQKEKYPYAARQAKQATVYQVLTMGFVVFSWIVWTVLFTILLIPLTANVPQGSDPGITFWIVTMSWIIPLLLMVVWWIYGLWGALRSWQGKEFNYIFLGRLNRD